ncbi:MAG TPA: cytochrome C biogenesis protein [Arenimonas sp.]|nr:cytochrome C biogenesis protein [Arenimonas sp.]
MTVFLLISVLLVALSALALRPLLATQRGLGIALLLALPAVTGLLYVSVGTPDALDPRNVRAPQSLDEAIEQLERRLAREPGETQGWLLLARSRMSQGRFDLARDAYAKAHALAPQEADIAVDYAEAELRSADDARMPESARQRLRAVLAAQPEQQKALFLLGLDRLQAGEAAEAVALWERLLPLVEPATADALRPQIDAARAQAGLPPAEARATEATVQGPQLKVRVELAAELAAPLPDTAVLYVFARTSDGAGLPVAVKRLAASGFPVEVVLSDADGLMPTQKLSAQREVSLLARISLSGDAAGASGDPEAEPVQVTVGSDAITVLRIDRIRP